MGSVSALAAVMLLQLTIGVLRGDGGVVIGGKSDQGLRMTVFAQPFPLTAGPADFSVLVQDESTGRPITDADVRLTLKKLSAPSVEKAWPAAYCQFPGTDGDIVLKQNLTWNRMLRSAMVLIREPGRWEIGIRVANGNGTVSAAIVQDVLPPVSPLLTWWPAVAIVPALVLFYVWRLALIRAKEKSRRIKTSARNGG